MKTLTVLLLGIVLCFFLVGCDAPLKSPPHGPEDKMINAREFDPLDVPPNSKTAVVRVGDFEWIMSSTTKKYVADRAQNHPLQGQEGIIYLF
jgi:hypothetical protein